MQNLNIEDDKDFKINKIQYGRILRKEHTTKLKQAKLKAKLKEESDEKLIECPHCNYICRTGWKKCPICETKVKRKFIKKQI